MGGGEIITGLRRQVIDIAGPKVRRHLLRDRALWYAVGGEQGQRVILVGLRRFGIESRKTDRVFLLLKRKEPECLVLENGAA